MQKLTHLLNSKNHKDFQSYLKKFISATTYKKLKDWFDISRSREPIQMSVSNAYSKIYGSQASLVNIYNMLREEIPEDEEPGDWRDFHDENPLWPKAI